MVRGEDVLLSGNGDSGLREGDIIEARNRNLAVGMKVEAQYRGKAKYYPGQISKDCGDGSYNVDYDGGEKEEGVKHDLIRAGDDEWCVGKIRKDRDNNTFDIDYDGEKGEGRYDGDKEKRVPLSLIRSRTLVRGLGRGRGPA